MGTTTRVKGDMDEKKPFNFALFWDKYGTFLSSQSSSRYLAPCRRSIS
ncbi:D-allose transport system permease protein AlsC [Klebsiella spallanzanii]|uniref:D-allose transport system permease protein AlsC n=1 Tax=Klebsiella spallanzanii TaxID=2587528 RepID=A0A564JDG2_9ENTR|nr:D-allose transport system permease protein AlsC [Klebsiella spallanzanii]